MIPGKYNIKIWRGSTWSIGLNSDPVDFASYDEIRMHVRPPFVKGVKTKPPLLELTLENGRITLEDSDQTLRLTVSAADTETFTWDEGIYDLEMVKYIDPMAEPPIAEEIVDKLIYGSVEVLGEQTV